MFKDDLNKLLEMNNLTAKELSAKADITESAMSRYRSGQRKPTLKVLKRIADALSVDLSYFTETIDTVENPITEKIPCLSVSEVANIMGLSPAIVRQGLRQGVFPWGYAIHSESEKWVYFINQVTFMRTEGISK